MGVLTQTDISSPAFISKIVTPLFDKVAPPAEYADPDVLDISFEVE